MKPEDIEAERARARAASVYSSLYQIRVHEDAARQAIEKWGKHPAFQAYMKEMHLTDGLAIFMAREPLGMKV